MIRAVAVLETMWDWRQMTSSAGYREAPRYFRINPQNFSGRRLYKLIGPNTQLLVTNACRELVSGPSKHGKPNVEWLSENLARLEPCDVILVCGKVAQDTFRKTEHVLFTFAHVLEIPHPAARGYWTTEAIRTTAEVISRLDRK